MTCIDPLRMVRMNCVPFIVEKITGERPNLATVYRWRERGLKGVKLKTAFAGGARRTTETWVREFFAAVTEAADGEPISPPSLPRTETRSQQIAKAEKELAAAGI